MKWKKTQINVNGNIVDAVAPEIISASRSTDIPAFYSEWFFGRINAGYTKWINPFNNAEQYISFENTKAIVFWSKNPRPLLPYLKMLDEKKIYYYIQYTVNDYQDENLEPNVPSLESRISTFKTLSNLIGPESVIWRFDPLILTDTITPDTLIKKIKVVGDSLYRYTSKLVFSFADVLNYKKVQDNLKRKKINYRDFTLQDIYTISKSISNLCKCWGIHAYTCGERIDLSEFGINHNKCIDDDLILKITNYDQKILNLFGRNKHNQISLIQTKQPTKNIKDTGQRAECGCIMSKDIGQYNTCPHMCVYCYANTSDNVVSRNIKKYTSNGDSIVAK